MAYQRDSVLFFPPNVPRTYKKYIAFQIIAATLVIFLWYRVNGGKFAILNTFDLNSDHVGLSRFTFVDMGHGKKSEWSLTRLYASVVIELVRDMIKAIIFSDRVQNPNLSAILHQSRTARMARRNTCKLSQPMDATVQHCPATVPAVTGIDRPKLGQRSHSTHNRRSTNGAEAL